MSRDLNKLSALAIKAAHPGERLPQAYRTSRRSTYMNTISVRSFAHADS